MPLYPFSRAVRSPGRLLFFAASAACLFFACVALAESQLLLTLENPQGETLYSAPVKEGSVFGIRYVHSVAQSPVTDYFVIKDGGIWLDRTVYEDFGAGLPHAPEEGQIMRQGNGKISISGYNRKLGSFQLRVGRVANHILILMPGLPPDASGPHWRELPLDKIAKPGSAITFAVRASAS